MTTPPSSSSSAAAPSTTAARSGAGDASTGARRAGASEGGGGGHGEPVEAGGATDDRGGGGASEIVGVGGDGATAARTEGGAGGGGAGAGAAGVAAAFRSVLPHEPPPAPRTGTTTTRGYVLLQGCLTPRTRSSIGSEKKRKQKEEERRDEHHNVRGTDDGGSRGSDVNATSGRCHDDDDVKTAAAAHHQPDGQRSAAAAAESTNGGENCGGGDDHHADSNDGAMRETVTTRLLDYFRGHRVGQRGAHGGPPPHGSSCLEVHLDPHHAHNKHKNAVVSKSTTSASASAAAAPITITRARIVYESHQQAREVCMYLKYHGVSPRDIFFAASSGDGGGGGGGGGGDGTNHDHDHNGDDDEGDDGGERYSAKPLQVSHVTCDDPLLPSSSHRWPYVSPPKFRRLLLTREDIARDGDGGAAMTSFLEGQKTTTRYVYLTGIGGAVETLLDFIGSGSQRRDGDPSTAATSTAASAAAAKNSAAYPASCVAMDAIRDLVRRTLQPTPSPNNEGEGGGGGGEGGVEVWIPQWNRPGKASTHCYLGMPSHADASALIGSLCGRSDVELTFRIPRWLLPPGDDDDGGGGDEGTAEVVKRVTIAERLFLDYADVTRRSYKKKRGGNKNGKKKHGSSHVPGHPPAAPAAADDDISGGGHSRSDCTFLTSHVTVPGLVLVENYLSPREEEVLMAALTGPDAPWAPGQRNSSKTGEVKRRVQHYGYVFDYETADVLRDRTEAGRGDCPPLPAVRVEAGWGDGDAARGNVVATGGDDEGGGDDDEEVARGESSGADAHAHHDVSTLTDGDVEDYISGAVGDLRGWDALAGVVERTRRRRFEIAHTIDDDTSSPPPSSDSGGTDLGKMGERIPASSRRKKKSVLLRFPNLNQMTVNEYAPGQGIGSHVDTTSAFGDGLISVSLNGGCVMEFRERWKPSEDDDGDDECECGGDDDSSGVGRQQLGGGRKPYRRRKLLHVPPRSLLLMSGPARYDWEHMIVSRRTDTVDGRVLPRKLRVSLTLRTALEEREGGHGGGSVGGPEGGRTPAATEEPPPPLPRVESPNFPPRWGGSPPVEPHRRRSRGGREDLVTPETERSHVHEVYDAIATQWHHTRGKRGVLWPSAANFLRNLPRGSIVADVGCGDGKYLRTGWEAGCFVLGSDISVPLLRQAAGFASSTEGGGRVPDVAAADCMDLPLRTDSCDAALCVAVLHHVSTVGRRLRCLSELARVVRPGGTIHVQAWAVEQKQDEYNAGNADADADADAGRRSGSGGGRKFRFAGTDVFVPFNVQPRYLDRVGTVGGGVAASDGEGGASAGGGGPVDARGETVKDVAALYSEAYENAEFDQDKGLVVFRRYCHVYREGELDDLVRRVGGLELFESGYESGNHYVVARVM